MADRPPERPPTVGAPRDWNNVSLDHLDVLLIVGPAFGVAWLLQRLGLHPPLWGVGLVMTPVVGALLLARRKLLPIRRAPTRRKLSAAGLLGLTLLFAGLLTGLFAGVVALRVGSPRVPEVDEAELQELARLSVSLPTLDVQELAPDAAPPAEAGTFQDLMADLDQPAKPEPTLVAQRLAELRAERVRELTEEAERARSRDLSLLLKAALLSGLLLAASAWLDRRRASADAAAQP